MKKEKLQWHPGFCAAIQIELEDQAGEMDFLSEYNLSKKPLQADLVIIKKQSDIPSGNENNLCGILSRYNILVCSKRPLKLLKYLIFCCKIVISTISP